MNEKNDFALPKPVFTVLISEDPLGDRAASAIKKSDWAQKYSLRFIHFKRATDLLTLARDQPFDLIFLSVGNIAWDTGSPTHLPKESTGGEFLNALKGNSAEVLGRLKLRYGKTIIVTDFSMDYMDLTKEFEGIGVNVLNYPADHDEFRKFIKAVLPTQITSK